MDKNILNQQSQHWETNFSNKPEMFGLDQSYSAEKTLNVLKENNLSNIVELGAGLGRDTIFFAKNSINVTALDYSKKGISIIDKKINELQESKKDEDKGDVLEEVMSYYKLKKMLSAKLNRVV